jgi:hypothetical protein
MVPVPAWLEAKLINKKQQTIRQRFIAALSRVLTKNQSKYYQPGKEKAHLVSRTALLSPALSSLSLV